MTNLNESEKKIILFLNSGYAKWFKTNKKNLHISTTKFRDFLLLVVDFFVLRKILANEVKNEFVLYNNSNFESYDFAALFGVEGLCEPAINYLDDDRFFWGLFGMNIFWIEFPSLALDTLLKVSNRFLEKKYSIEKKSSSLTSFMLMKSTIRDYSNYHNILHVRNLLTKNISNFQQEVNEISNLSNDYFHFKTANKSHIRLFRGFHYGEDENVRTGRNLKNNPLAYKQENGKSISFTLDKKTATNFAINYHLSSTVIDQWSKRVSGNELLLKINNLNKNDFLKSQKRRPSIGVYEVAVKDILLFSCRPMSEYEVLVFPENAKLIRYDPIKFS